MPRDDRCVILGIMFACREYHIRPPISRSLLTNNNIYTAQKIQVLA